MLKLEDIKKDLQINGLTANEAATVVTVSPIIDDSVTVVYKTHSGVYGDQVLYRSSEEKLSLAQAGLAWPFNSPSPEFKLALEAMRIQMAFLFDPMMAIHTSNVEPLPHQISAVYEAMLPKQPLRFVLADDPGAGKTIMAGLLIKELLMRADVQRVLIVAPGSLTEQWQDEMREKFTIDFKLFSREQDNLSPSGNYFNDENLLIARIDQLARANDLQQKLQAVQWDLIIVDEAHKLSAYQFASKVHKTQRYQLGELLGRSTRHLLLMTATPHNGNEDDFRLWLSLLDGDRFYAKGGNNEKLDVSDVMRRMVKEELLRFNGTRLFPKREAKTVKYELSDPEAELYKDVTYYVVAEMNRAEKLANNGKNQVGFALIMLQRRLASSPAAIHQSLRRRIERLETKLKEMKKIAGGRKIIGQDAPNPGGALALNESYAEYNEKRKVELPDDYDDLEDDLSPEEYENVIENVIDEVIDSSTAAKTAEEIEIEIKNLRKLEKKAAAIRDSGKDCKWEKLSNMLQEFPEMRNEAGARRKLIIFTEHRDTLNYLESKISGLLGNAAAVRVIHGGTHRDARKQVQEDFCNNPDVLVLIATDAAGEGVNLQKANLMINYDLPWNPNRLEQRFGRIHRIGQTETCYMWNLVAPETREGEVFNTLFQKLETARQNLGGRVFDVLGNAFEQVSLKELLLQAIRNGQEPETQKYMTETVDKVLDVAHLQEILNRNSLAEQTMTPESLYTIKEEMDKAEARKLQPCFVSAFFKAAFESLGGQIRRREKGRYEIPNVPQCIRENERVTGRSRAPIAKKYERICFDKSHKRPSAKAAEAAFIHPGHPLMQSLTDCILQKHRALLKPGTVMIDPHDEGQNPSLLFMVDHSITEYEGDKLVSRRLQFVRMFADGTVQNAGWAPHLDLSDPAAEDLKLAQTVKKQNWLQQDLEKKAVEYAKANMAKDHLDEVSARRRIQVKKTLEAVQSRLVAGINYWNGRAIQLEAEFKAGRQPQVQAINARETANELGGRLEKRKAELEKMQYVVAKSPIVMGGILVLPQGWLNIQKGEKTPPPDPDARKRVELIAMKKVMEVEKSFGHTVKDVSAENCGWDVTADVPQNDPNAPIKNSRHIEVKGRVKTAERVTLSHNEICYAVNQKDKFILALVLVDGEEAEGPYYIRGIFNQEPDWGVKGCEYGIRELLEKAVRPEETLY